MVGSMLDGQGYVLDQDGCAAVVSFIALRRVQPHLANARLTRNALDWACLRQAKRLFETAKGSLDDAALSAIKAEDLRGISVVQGGLDVEDGHA